MWFVCVCVFVGFFFLGGWQEDNVDGLTTTKVQDSSPRVIVAKAKSSCILKDAVINK